MRQTATLLTLQPGDIAACYGVDWTSRLIRYGTASLLGPRDLRCPPSHVAMCCRHNDQSLWVESTTLCPHSCLIRQKPVSGVQAHRPRNRMHDYLDHGGRVDIYRLTEINRLSDVESELLSHILLNHFVKRNVRYDVGGALLSGSRMFQRTQLFPGADLERLFCSELIAAVLMRLGRLNHDNPTRFHPGRLMRGLVLTGKYHRVASYQRSRSCDEC